MKNTDGIEKEPVKRAPFSFLLLAVIFLLPAFLYCQTEELNLKKYWHYRQRLIDRFMVVGPDEGQSIPAGIRNLWNGPSLHFGDSPVYLGYYIGVLATEYSLLTGNAQKTSRTLTELYYALEAINRLDERAESLWGMPNKNHEHNGFLLSDDVPSDFCQRYSQELNRSVSDTPAIKGSGICGVVNNVITGIDLASPINNVCSQDHLTCLLFGLALCKNYLTDSIPFRDALSGEMRTYSFRSSAISIAANIMHYLRDKPFGGISWILRTPDKKNISNLRGGQAVPNAYGFAEAGRFITGKEYGNVLSRLSTVYWKSIYRFPGLTRLHPDDLLFGLELSCIGDSWRGHGKKSKTLKRINRLGNYRASKLHLWAANQYGWDLFYGSVYSLLYQPGQQTGNLVLASVIHTLNEAPYEGPFYHGGTDAAPNGWAGSSGRFYDKPPDQLTGKSDFPGNYNGLDYMLFYNLYCLRRSPDSLPRSGPPSYYITNEFSSGL